MKIRILETLSVCSGMEARHKGLGFALITSLLISLPATAANVGLVSVRDAIGVRATAAAPHVADREGSEPLLTLTPAALDVPEKIDAMRQWNERGGLPAQSGFARSFGETLRVRFVPGEISPFSARVAKGSKYFPNVWGGSVRVEGAYRLRIHLQNVVVPPGTIFWVYGRAGAEIAFGTELIDNNGDLYTPTVKGDTAYLEMELPMGSAGGSFDVSSVMEGFGVPKPNDSSSCLFDATCAPSEMLDVIDQVRRAVAYLEVVDTDILKTCTGGLVNDTVTSSTIPYLLTSNNCFRGQSGATSLEAFWDFKSATCGGPEPDLFSMQRSSGSTFIASGTVSDFTFVRLNSVPSNRVFLGWNSDPSVITHGKKLHRISHPFQAGSFLGPGIQMYSESFASLNSATCSGAPRGPFIYSTAGTGGVYRGSSGAPVILPGGVIVGQLSGSCGSDPTAGCDPSILTVDGAFSTTYNEINGYLNPGAPPPPPPPPTAGCTPTSTTGCMLGNRFRATVRYRNAFDNGAVDTNAQLKNVTGFASSNFETAFFFFNSENNLEIMVKLLDQGNVNAQAQPTIAVLFGTATPLRIELTLFDTLRGTSKTYISEFGSMQGVTDFTAFVK